jgi:peptidoglycan/LPS O-acetylase OafA/YrhL
MLGEGGRASSTADGADGHPRLEHQPALDGMRGLAVAGVLLFHGGKLAGGFLGVDAFFVLSGFLITSLLLVEARRGGVALRSFWARRARRLLPALAGMLSGVALYAVFIAKPDELATIRGDALATIGYVANWRAIATSRDYWALFRKPSPLDHTWSLAIEEQFYILWPLVVALLAYGRRGTAAARRVLVVSATLALASLVWTLVIYNPANPSRVYYGTDTRSASILIGAALAAWLALRGPVRARPARIALEVGGAGALVLLAVAWTRSSGSSSTLYRGGLFACAIATAAVIATAVHPRRGPIQRVLSFRPLRALGVISYGVYLWHWPIYLVLSAPRVDIGGWSLLAVRVAASLAVAVLSYRLVERPVRYPTRSWPAPRRVALALTSVTVVVASILVATAGASQPRVVVADQIRRAPPPLPPAQAHVVGRKPVLVPPRVLVVGNSIALYAADEGFKRLQTTPRLDVLNLGSIGCRLLPEETRTRYPSGDMYVSQSNVCRNNWALAVSLYRPNLVVLLVADPTDAVHEIDGHWTEPCRPLYDAVLETELHDQIHLLASKGATVVVTTAAYAGLPGKSPTWFQHNDCQNAIFRRVAASEPHAIMADIFTWMCPHMDQDCDTHLGAVVLRPDGVHFRDASARALAAWLIEQAQRHGALTNVRVVGTDRSFLGVRPS